MVKLTLEMRSVFMLKVNDDKQRDCIIDQIRYSRYAIATHVISDEDTLQEVLQHYVLPEVQCGDIVFLSEKMVACTQHRAILLETIKPSFLARLLSRFVVKTKRGIGLGMPETMEMAIQECGAFRILLAAMIGFLGKCLGKKGWFYHFAGKKAATIDGPCAYTLPPYNHYVVLGPSQPNETAKKCAEVVGCPVVIVDINDYGAEILGVSSHDLNCNLMRQVLQDNPLGQSNQCTPVGIVRRNDI